jgi:hypothetical protein
MPSRFALEIEHDSVRALEFIRQKWSVHKTPTMRALLAAAVACHDAATAQAGSGLGGSNQP